jgi:hypothetical protein
VAAVDCRQPREASGSRATRGTFRIGRRPPPTQDCVQINGNVLFDEKAGHVFQIGDGLIKRFDIRK